MFLNWVNIEFTKKISVELPVCFGICLHYNHMSWYFTAELKMYKKRKEKEKKEKKSRKNSIHWILTDIQVQGFCQINFFLNLKKKLKILDKSNYGKSKKFQKSRNFQ